MKDLLLSRIFCLIIIFPFGVTLVAHSCAQGSTTVTPEIKEDTLRRLDLSRNFQVSKPNGGDGGWKKMVMRVCNKGPKGDDTFTQPEACNDIAAEQFGRKGATLDELMPSFKACSVSDGDDYGCKQLMDNLNSSGHADYALAVAIYAPNCHSRCRSLSDFVATSSDGLRLTLIRSIVLTGRTDIAQVLERSCQVDGNEQGCQWYAQIGGSYDEAERQQAVNATKAGYDQSHANSENQMNRADNSPPGFMSTLAGALTNVQQTTPSSMPYPQTAQTSQSTAPGQNASAPGNSQCQWMTSSVSRTLHFNLDHAANYCTQGSRDIQWIYTNHSSTYVVCTVRAWSNGSISNGSMEIAPNAEAVGENSCARDGQSEYVCYPQVGATASCLNVNWTIN